MLDRPPQFGIRLSNIVLRVAVAANLLLLMYMVVDSPGRLAGWGAIATSYVLPSATLGLLLVTFRAPPAWRVNVSIGCLSLGAVLLSAEAFVRAAQLVNTAPVGVPECERYLLRDGRVEGAIGVHRCRRVRAEGRPWDPRSAVEVLGDMRVDGIQAWPSLPPRLLSTGRMRVVTDAGEIAPVGGISGVPTVFCNERGPWIIFESDEHGFRNPRGLYDAPADVVILGDSFTQGQCVASGETFADAIRDVFPRTVNLAYSDNGPLLALASFVEYGVHLKPRNTIWFFFEGNDLNNLETETADPLLVRYLERHTHALMTHQDDIDRDLKVHAERERQSTLAALAAYEERRAAEDTIPPTREPTIRSSPVVRFLLATELRRFLRQRIAAIRAPSPPLVHPFDAESFRTILAIAKEHAASWGGTFTMAYLPDWTSVAGGRPAIPHRDLILQIAAEEGVPVIDLLPEFVAARDPSSLFEAPSGGHYNERGHRVVAKTVLRYLH